jgi:hypothetical protein
MLWPRRFEEQHSLGTGIVLPVTAVIMGVQVPPDFVR